MKQTSANKKAYKKILKPRKKKGDATADLQLAVCEKANEPVVCEMAAQVVAKAEPVYCRGNGVWTTQYEAVAGLSHRDARPPLPCQDAALALNLPRCLLVVADGAGSSSVSDMGSQVVVTGLARLLNTLDHQVTHLLDQPEAPETDTARRFALLLVKHAKGLLDDLAGMHRRPQHDFRCTLLLLLVGEHHSLWLKVGDGALLVESLELSTDTDISSADSPDHSQSEAVCVKWQPRLRTLGSVGKGEFANQTTFIDSLLKPADVQSGTFPTKTATGLAAMSDGAADRLVATDGSRASQQVSSWLKELREDRLKRRQLTRRFYSDEFTCGTSGDDCSIALAAVGLEVPG